jgi:hypothetical protein
VLATELAHREAPTTMNRTRRELRVYLLATAAIAVGIASWIVPRVRGPAALFTLGVVLGLTIRWLSRAGERIPRSDARLADDIGAAAPDGFDHLRPGP